MLAGLPEAEGFALAGGAALIIRGDVERLTRDLDFFAPPGSDVGRLVMAISDAAASAGMRVEPLRLSATFARLMVHRGEAAVPVDLGTDARIRPLESSVVGPVLSGEELAADKLLALFGRAEARDFVDVMALESRYGLDRMCRLALEKDLRFRRDVLATMIERFNTIPLADFDVDAATHEKLGAAVRRWIAELTTGAPDQWRRRRGPNKQASSDFGL